MKKIVLIILAFSIVNSCSKDEDPAPLATPSLDWAPSSVNSNTLEISITIDSPEGLPEGTLEFSVDGNRVNTYQPNKGTSTYNTAYTFDDLETHTAKLSYLFSDGRSSVDKTISIKKSVQQVTQKSSKSDWMDL
nr:hypothetical protein [Allomuricauda sp.]